MMTPERIAKGIRDRIRFGNNGLRPGTLATITSGRNFEKFNACLPFPELAISLES